MSSQEYLETLDATLSKVVPARERMDILRYYKEYFEEAGPGKEASVIEELGDPVKLAHKIASEGGFSGGEADADHQRQRKIRRWAVVGVVVVLLAALVTAIIELGFAMLARIPEPNSVPVSGTVADRPTAPPQVSSEPSEEPLDTRDAAQYTAVDVKIGIGHICLRTGEDFDLQLESEGADKYGTEYELHYEVVNGKLHIWSTPRSLETDGEGQISASVVITVPKDWKLEMVDLKTSMGNIEAENIMAGKVDAENSMGNVSLENIVADEIDAEISMGDVSAEQISTRKLSISNKMGNVTLRGALAEKTDLATSMGRISVNADCAAVDCTYKLETSMGDITVDGQSFDSKAEKQSGSLYVLKAENSMGNIDVQFAK